MRLPFEVVRGHENYSGLGAGDAVQAVQQAAEGDAV